LRSQDVSLVICANLAANPWPVTFTAQEMLLIKGQGPLRVALSDIARVEIAGSAESLSALADWFVFAADFDNRTHQHYQ
jgi:hypothetical protein